MFEKILIANRGEIACRVIKTARRLGIATVAVYSEADANSRHVRMADEAVLIGPASARESYLRADKILEAARATGAQAVHPGYGFLSENDAFAAACAVAGIVFIGPPASAIRAMGSKSAAKALMATAGVPLTPGYHGDNQEGAFLADEAGKIGYPVLIKASAGGGGKGMRRVDTPGDFAAALASCQREARNAFGNDQVLVEKYVLKPRHIEIQVFGDTHGSCVYLFERDCSVQRRHQKVLEEAPAPGMTRERRAAMGQAAVNAAKAVGYVGAGTVEFIANPDGSFYFMEMNTRLQVEHPVTEMITGLDLVEWQFRVAAGQALPLAQDALNINGHAIEARLYAEDPERGFLPSIGTLVHWRMPAPTPQVRVDTGVRDGDEVSPFYDPMLAKLIVWGEDRQVACARMLAALAGCEVVGVATNVALLERIVAHEAFASGRVDTGLIERHREALFPAAGPVPERALLAAAVAEFIGIEFDAREAAQASGDPYSPWHVRDAWWANSDRHGVALCYADAAERVELQVRPAGDHRLRVRLPEREVMVSFDEVDGRLVLDVDDTTLSATVIADGEMRQVFAGGVRRRLQLVDPLAHAADDEPGGGHLTAPMSGAVVAVLVAPGDRVSKGAPLIVLEAMKMEHTIVAPADGVVAAVNFRIGDRVAEGADLVDIEEA